MGRRCADRPTWGRSFPEAGDATIAGVCCCPSARRSRPAPVPQQHRPRPRAPRLTPRGARPAAPHQADRLAPAWSSQPCAAAFPEPIGRPSPSPETFRRWHRELVGRKWVACARRRGPGGPRSRPRRRPWSSSSRTRNPGWGYQRVRGDLLKLGHSISTATIRPLLRRHGLPSAPGAGPSWHAFLRAHTASVLACDFVTVETLPLQMLCVIMQAFGDLFYERRRYRIMLTAPWSRSVSWSSVARR